jgi:hypothetical protein
MHEAEPVLHPVKIADLRPTQITVGLREVARKRRQWRERVERDGPDFLGRHMIPAVRGPKDHLWIIDAHHLSRALYDEGVEHVLAQVVADLSSLNDRRFRTYMDNRGWFHPFDADGKRQPAKTLPRHVRHLADDPHRSLAGELRRAGGFAKDMTPFSEFLWADYLRDTIGREAIEKDFEKALQKALKLARDSKAAYLPGWVGTQS